LRTLKAMPLEKSIIARTLETKRGERAYAIAETLQDAGYEAWWVGGGVRDMLLGIVPHDIDIATSALPEQILPLFTRGKDDDAHLGSVRVLLGEDTFEVTTFREDDEASDGRHPESVAFGSRDADMRRRDFTVNALYWNPVTGEMLDPFGGQEDLKEKLLRFIGEPGIRIRHDALRILRAVRFRAALGGQYHPETYRALRENAQAVEGLSGARVRMELEKMLLTPQPDLALQDLHDIGALPYLLPEIQACKGVPQPADYHHEGDVWEHTMQCLRSLRPDDNVDVRLAILFHDCGKAETFSLKERIRFDHHASVSAALAKAAFTRMQMPADRSRKIQWIIAHHMSMTFLDMPDERKAHWYFHPWFPELLRIFYLDVAGTTPSDFTLYESIVRDCDRFLDAHPRPEKPLLSGQEVMDILGIRPGAQVGEALQALHDAQVKGAVTTKSEARDFLLSQAERLTSAS
jgi:tRNA nucleotidyltransferase/poly(A) polymerase